MNSFITYLLILVLLQLHNGSTFGKTMVSAAATTQRTESLSVPKISVGEIVPEETIDTRVRRSYGYNQDDFLINQLSGESDITTSNLLDSAVACNNLNEIESDQIVRDSFRSLYNPLCSHTCRSEVLSKIADVTQCNEFKIRDIAFQRDRRAKFDFSRDDLFVPVRGRRGSDMEQSTSPRISAEKKAKLDVLMNDLFVPNRGKRQLVRKHFLFFDPYLQVDKRSRNLELDMKDYFVPHRGKRQRNKIDEILFENFFPQRGKKDSIPKSHSLVLDDYDTFEQWLFQNINSDKAHLIDPSNDLNIGKKRNKDVTSITTITPQERQIPQIFNNYEENKRESVPATLMFNPISNDGFIASDGSANLILQNTPLSNHVPRDDFTSTTFI